MRGLWTGAAVVLCFGMQQAVAQTPPVKATIQPVEATVCQILSAPYEYNNKLVRVRGFVEVSAEYSTLSDDTCSGGMGMWFTLPDNVGLPGLRMFVTGNGVAGGTSANGRRAPPLPVTLVKDANYKEFEHYVRLSADADACRRKPPRDFPPQCTSYRVTATFTGRIDGVSKAIHETRKKRVSGDRLDRAGFGHIGLFEAQMVMQSVQDLMVEDEDQVRSHPSGRTIETY